MDKDLPIDIIYLLCIGRQMFIVECSNFVGQFSLPNDKRQFYEFDIRVPLMVRGPGVAAGQIRKDLVLNIDLAPTFLDMAGITPPADMDGQSFKHALHHPSPANAVRTDFLVEHTGEYDFKQPQCPSLNGQPLNVS